MMKQEAAPGALGIRGSVPTEPDPQSYNSFVAMLDLMDIELVKVHGERTGPGGVAQARFDLTAGYMIDNDIIQYRYEVTAHFVDDAGTVIGEASSSVILVAKDAPTTDVACIEHFGATSGALMVHPYLRESIASTAQRIGFAGILLPMIKYHPDESSDN